MTAQLTQEQKINNVKQSYVYIKQFLNATTDTITIIVGWLDISDIELNQKITGADVLGELLMIASDCVTYIKYLKHDYLDSGFR